MDIGLISTALVFFGAVSMLIAIFATKTLRQDVPLDLQKKWLAITLFMTFFLIGYIVFIIALLTQFPVPIELITGSVFLGGAIFVLIMVNISKTTIRNIKLKENEIDRNRQKIQGALDEISNLMNHVIEQNSEAVQCKNPDLHQLTCYEIKKCDQQDCLCYGKEPMRCWQIAGTFCGGEVQGLFAHKYKSCIQCEVYKLASSDPILQIEEQFNNMMHVIRQKNEELLEKESCLSSIVETAIDAIISIDGKGEVYSWNQGAEQMFGYPASTIIGENVISLMPEKYRNAYKRGLKRFLSSDKSKNLGKSIEIVGLRRDGTEFPVELSVSKWNVGDESYFTSIIRDITERKNAEQKLHSMAYFDQLTSLPNRINFISHLERMIKRSQQQSDHLFAVLFIDLDRFKLINDSLGHIIGDKLLVEVARRLETCTRPTDIIYRDSINDNVSRFGGDEFAVFLDDIKDIRSASRVADRIQVELQKPFNLDGHELYTSASIGIAMNTTGYVNAEDILRDADSAMYRAKTLGKARAEIFDDHMRVKVSQILKLESDLRTAVEKEQLILYYQPIVVATDSRITGVEALLRWNHPQQGFISPTDFIPIAEETGLISTIGEWVLRTACAQNKAWQDAGYRHLLMKVNFSSRQFKDSDLPELVTKIIRETGISAQFIDVEITESVAMEKNSIKVLKQLTAMGLHTSIDDFGTGYSSLGSLTQLPINSLKIDRTFVKEIESDNNAHSIIKAIIAMAHNLNMEVVAEGVETEGQLSFLHSNQCDKIQGYLFSPPLPAEEFIQLLEKEKSGHPIIQTHSIPMG